MHRYLFGFINKLKLRWKLLVVVLPLVIVPIFVVGGVIGYISTQQAYLGITQTSKADLEHMTSFTIDLFNSHHQQFQVYKQDKERSFKLELATLTNIAYNMVEAGQRQSRSKWRQVLAPQPEREQTARRGCSLPKRTGPAAGCD